MCIRDRRCTNLTVSSTLYRLYILDTVWLLNLYWPDIPNTVWTWWLHPQHCMNLTVSSTLYRLYIFNTVWILNTVWTRYPKHCMNMTASSTWYEPDCVLNSVCNLHPTPYAPCTFDTVQTLAVSSVLHGLWILYTLLTLTTSWTLFWPHPQHCKDFVCELSVI